MIDAGLRFGQHFRNFNLETHSHMLTFQWACAALHRSSRMPREWSSLHDRSILRFVVLRSSASLLHAPTRSGRSANQGFLFGVRGFSVLLNNGVATRRSAPASMPVISFPPKYELLPDDVHCFVGLNGSGKTQFLAKLQDHVKVQQAQGQLPLSFRLATLSLDAHREF